MRKNLKFIFTFFFIFLFLTSSVFAASTTIPKSNVSMELVEDNVCNIEFGKYGKFTKKMVKINTEDKTVDIKLTAENNYDGPTTKTNTTSDTNPAEVVLLIDNSNSMSVQYATPTTTRKNLVLNSAKQLVSKLFKDNSKVKIGVVEFATSTDESKKGTVNDARALTSSLISDESAVDNALNTISNEKMGAQTNIVAGLDVASKLFSSNSNSKKYIILLTDAIPNTAYGITYDKYTNATADPTKAKLQEVKNAGITPISLLIHMTDNPIEISEENPKPTYLEKANYIFGTEANPTAGLVYYVDDDNVTDTIVNSIYNDLTWSKEETVDISDSYTIHDIKIKDYFPDYIVNNFDFAYITNPTKGSISTKIDKTDNSITWTIPELKPGENVDVTYRLKLKDNVDANVINKNLNTNKDVTIDYKLNGKDQDQVHNDKCPVIKLTTVSAPKNNNVDDTVAPKKLPQTGENGGIIIGSAICLAAMVAILNIYLYRRNK